MYPFIDLGVYKQPVYGLVLAFTFLLIYWRLWKTAPRFGLKKDHIGSLFFWILLGGFLGARILYCIVEWRDFVDDPLGMVFSRTNFVFYGGFVGGLVSGWIYTRKMGILFWEAADFVSPYIALGHGIGRLGCFMYGCCFGKVCQLPWGVRFPKWKEGLDIVGSPAFLYHYHEGWLNLDEKFSLPVHPTQIYEMVSLFVLFVMLLLGREKKSFSGQMFLFYLLGYSVIRFVVEYFRGDPRGSWFGILSTSQGISILVFIFALWFHKKMAK